MKRFLAWTMTCVCFYSVGAQELGFKTLELSSMEGFEAQAGNWRVVGQVNMNPNVSIHHREQPSVKKKKRKKNNSVIPQAVSVEEGGGVLVNLPTEEDKSNLLTSWEHGDIALDLEVMLPKGSNSGLYLQGRYEVQLFDSWAVKNPKFSDMGGIYRNWESDPLTSYMGKAPLANAAKAPGLWQRLQIRFMAPKFDASGKKVSNARIVSVILNGVTIHENVELPFPTGGALGQEVAMGPIMIQGDHGAVAIRNFSYRLLSDLEADLSGIDYQVFYGDYESYADLMEETTPELTGHLEQLDYAVAQRENRFAIMYQGILNVPKLADYSLRASFGGVGLLKIDGEEVGSGWRGFVGQQTLSAGDHQVELIYSKTTSWLDPYLGLFISSPNGHEKALHTSSSHPVTTSTVAPIFIHAEGNQPRLLRAFLDFEGDRSRRITHAIGVGVPTGMNYVYDLGSGNLACVWRGDFVDATPMWHDRGDGSFRPLGMLQYLYQGVSIAGEVRSKGYVIDPDSGLPTFIYEVDGQEVRDRVYPDESAGKMIREVDAGGLPGTFEVTESDRIEPMENGWYAIGDRSYYVQIMSGQTPQVVRQGDKYQLMLAIDSNPIKYSIIW